MANPNPNVVTLRKRPFPRRFINSYRLWRKDRGVWTSLCAAWTIAWLRPHSDKARNSYYDPKQFRRQRAMI